MLRFYGDVWYRRADLKTRAASVGVRKREVLIDGNVRVWRCNEIVIILSSPIVVIDKNGLARGLGITDPDMERYKQCIVFFFTFSFLHMEFECKLLSTL